MGEPLPAIDIFIREQPRRFLEEMAELAGASDRFEIKLHVDALRQLGMDALNLRLKQRNPSQGLGCQLLAFPGTDRIAVEARADRWSPDPPTRDSYVEAVRLQIQPLLASYNRRHSTHYRFRVEKAGAGPSVSPALRKLLDRFAGCANKAPLHPLDWKRLYELVRDSRQRLFCADFEALLIERSFPADKAAHVSDIYSHLWGYKKVG